MTASPGLPSFTTQVDEILTPLMEARDFEVIERTGWWVDYRRGGRRVSFGYEDRDLPRAWLSITVALEEPDGRTRSVGLWRAIPESDPASKYFEWRFGTEAELRGVLQRVAREVLPHVFELADSEETLTALLADRRAEVEKDYQDSLHERNLESARKAFDSGRYAEARDEYILIGEEHLSAADRRRLYVARQHLSSSET